jgi:hypothetical protein
MTDFFPKKNIPFQKKIYLMIAPFDRESMLFEITTVCSNFRNLNSQNKVIWLFNSENIELLKHYVNLF